MANKMIAAPGNAVWKDLSLILNGVQLNSSNLKDKESQLDATLYDFLKKWWNDEDFMKVHTSGSTGAPKLIEIKKRSMLASARLTCEYLGLKKGMNALLCMDLKHIGGIMMLIRSMLWDLNLFYQKASSRPLVNFSEKIDFAAMVPLQVYKSLQNEEEKLRSIATLLIGGAAVDPALEASLSTFPNKVYSTYGMTETISHIGMRRLNAAGHTETHIPNRYTTLRYVALPTIKVSRSNLGTIQIKAPYLSSDVITNDLCNIYDDSSFEIIGRLDNVINTGGIKVNPEEVERILNKHFKLKSILSSIPDNLLGERLILLIERASYLNSKLKESPLAKDNVPLLFGLSKGTEGLKGDFFTLLKDELDKIKNILPKYHDPKEALVIDVLPRLTCSDFVVSKPDRKKCRELCLDFFA